MITCAPSCNWTARRSKGRARVPLDPRPPAPRKGGWAAPKGDAPQARVLDLTRSLRRVGRMATGVDRVERAYLKHLMTQDAPFYGLCRTAFGYVLLDAEGLRRFSDCLDGAPWDKPGLLSRLPRGRDAALERAESTVRRLSVARASPAGLKRMLARLPEGFAYLNVGHSNLTDRVLSSVARAGGHISVMVHDVIPLDYPTFQRPGTVAPFEEKLRRVGRYADLVLYNSQDTQHRCEGYLHRWGRVPRGIVAHLGVEVPTPDGDLLARLLPDRSLLDRPYFVVLGTIEPRKNHAFLLDIWGRLGPEAPGLMICGSRGWNNDAVFARLDDLPPESPIRELGALPDEAISALLQGSAGLLFPSHAEGFGLPPAEALRLGTRVLCNNLSVLREILGDKAVYAPVTDGYLWEDIIINWAKTPPDTQETVPLDGLKWSDHFKIVLRIP
jgi:glycosyltransferase involved in cell wall biosynthesis